MADCPVCNASTEQKHGDTPYWVCPDCDCWFQDPMPPKTFIANFEGDPSVMSDADRAVNASLAQFIFHDVMHGKAGHTLDVGAKLPVLAHEFRKLGCNAWVLEHEPIKHMLPVQCIQVDFEGYDPGESYDLVTVIHTLEHLYRPREAMQKLRRLVKDDGALFVRIPDHGVSGFERDLTPGHYSIHPFYYAFPSILELLVQTDTFTVTWQSAMAGAGQRDIVLRPL